MQVVSLHSWVISFYPLFCRDFLKSLIYWCFSFYVWHSFGFILFLFPYCIFNGVPIHVFSYHLGQDASLLVIILNKDPLLHACLLTQVCPTLCKPMDCSPPGFCVSGTFQARLLEWVAISSSRGSSWPRDQTHVSCVYCICRQILYHWATWEALMLI